MTGVRFFSLYSSSTGNAFLLETPAGCILLDCGKSARRLFDALKTAGIAPDQIRALFLTHEHSDHTGALSTFLKYCPIPVHLPEQSAEKLKLDPLIAKHLVPHAVPFTVMTENVTVSAFATPHDSFGSVGYRFDVTDQQGNAMRIGYATDLGFVSDSVRESLLGCDAVVLESNHDPDLLENGPYPAFLKRRILSSTGHLSNAECAQFAAELCEGGTRSLMLAHLSLQNNRPDLALAECMGAVGDRIPVCTADPYEITELILP